MIAPATGLQPGFQDPVHDAQRCFRAVLDAMSHPGRVIELSGVTPPSGLNAAAAAVLLTLADHETPLWLDAPDAKGWIAFHCGAPIVDAPARCRLAVVHGAAKYGDFPAGTHEEPESGATVIQQLSSLTTGPSFRLAGPGLREPVLFRAEGLGAGFASSWRANHALFPRGLDLILCAGNLLAALPRSVMIQEV